MTSFATKLSYSSLSLLGVDQLLASDLDLLAERYQGVLELQERMLPVNVLDTVRTMNSIIENMEGKTNEYHNTSLMISQYWLR